MRVVAGKDWLLIGFVSAITFAILASFIYGNKLISSPGVKYYLDPIYQSASEFIQSKKSFFATDYTMTDEYDELRTVIDEAIQNHTLWTLAKSELSKHPITNCSDRRRLGKDVGAMDQEPYSICFDAPYAPRKSGKCLVYSFGIANEWDFDDQIASQHNCTVLAFDPSMNLADNTTRPSGVNFWKIGLAPRNFICVPDGKEVYGNKNPGNWTMRTLRSVAEQFGHAKEDTIIDILKVDVEGAEVESLHQAISDGFLQNHVMQLTLEWHLWFELNNTATLTQLIKTHDEIVTKAGFESFHFATRTVGNGVFPLECFVNKNLAEKRKK